MNHFSDKLQQITYKPYPKYKESEVEWLGEIPEHWNKTKLKFLGFTYGGLSGKAGKDFNDEDNKLSKPFIPFTNIAKSMYIEDNYFGLVVINKGEEQNRAKKDDLFFLMSSEDYEDLGKSSLLDFEVKELYLNSFCKGFRLLDINIFPKFLNYLLHGDVYRKLLYTQGNGFTRINLRLEKLNDLTMCMPPLQEQKIIANYLDKATTKIDTLIAKQERLIALLKEKRQALISHTVTKGLNPDVKMKDSGIEWLGEIPEHWTVKKLKYNLILQTNKIEITNQQVIALENIQSWSGKHISTDSSYQGDDVAFQDGDILFGKLRPYLAKVYKCTNEGVAFGDILVYRPTKNTDSSFSFYTMISEAFIDIVNGSTYGSKMPRASVDFVSDMPMAMPSKEEQISIGKYLDNKTSKIDTLINKATKAIELLKERRTALISAVVTGKIDVREYA